MRPPLIKTDMGSNPLLGSVRLYTTFQPGASIGIALDPDRDREAVDLVTQGREADEAYGHAAGPAAFGGRERGLDFVKKNALKGFSFTSLDEQNRHLLAWETTVADVR